MDPIRRMAESFSYNMESHGFSLEKIDSELNSKLIYINRNSEKLRFLSYLRDIAETEYKEHAPNCHNPENCGKNQALENVIYAIDQQYAEYVDSDNGISLTERPAMQFFVEGQYFDAFSAIKEILKEAKTSIVLVDGYVSSDTLAFFPGKEPTIKLRILTDKKSIGAEFERAKDLYNKQYGNLEINTSSNFHDRFLILDNQNFYHIGASIKDAGNKTFMFTKIEDESLKDTVRKKIESEWPKIYS